MDALYGKEIRHPSLRGGFVSRGAAVDLWPESGCLHLSLRSLCENSCVLRHGHLLSLGQAPNTSSRLPRLSSKTRLISMGDIPIAAVMRQGADFEERRHSHPSFPSERTGVISACSRWATGIRAVRLRPCQKKGHKSPETLSGYQKAFMALIVFTEMDTRGGDHGLPVRNPPGIPLNDRLRCLS